MASDATGYNRVPVLECDDLIYLTTHYMQKKKKKKVTISAF